MSLLSLEEARVLILHNIQEMPPEDKPLSQTLGLIAAEDIRADINVPGWDASALDGFAVRSEDIPTASPDHPVRLRVIENIPAGRKATRTLTSGDAIRIMTGAPIPANADCVVGFEYCEVDGNEIRVKRSVACGGNIRGRGDQIRKGLVVIRRGQVIGPGEIGIAASLGKTSLKVIRRPQVAIISSGEELVQPGKPLPDAKIYCGNSSALAAQISCCGGIPRVLNIARDNLPAVRRMMQRGLQYDFVITTGGSAQGDRDLIKEVMTEMGVIHFSRINIVPGKTTAFGQLRNNTDGRMVPHLALAGSPGAAMLGFEMLARPAILKMLGLNYYLKTIPAGAARTIINRGGKPRLVWVSLRCGAGGWTAEEADRGGILPSITAANGIALIPAESERIEVGEILPVVPLSWINILNDWIQVSS